VHTVSVIALMMAAVRTSETLVNFNVATWRYIPEDSELHHLQHVAFLHFPWIYKSRQIKFCTADIKFIRFA
jgi:hypothetical protein